MFEEFFMPVLEEEGCSDMMFQEGGNAFVFSHCSMGWISWIGSFH
jgi:hypothetical protein